jgi:hypothetical protein
MRLRSVTGGALAAFAMLLSSCGGGSGDTPSVDTSRSSLEFIALSGSTAGSQSIGISLNGGTGVVYARAGASGNFDTTVRVTSDTTASISVTPRGIHTSPASGSVTLQLCRDIACTQVVWSRDYGYTLSIIDLSPRSFSFSGYEGVSPEPQVLTLSPADPQRRFSVDTGDAWLGVERISDSSFRITASGNAVAAGNHEGHLTLRHTTAGAVTALNASFSVGNGTVTPAARVIDVRAGTEVSDLSGAIPVDFQGGGAPTWTAVADQPWLVLPAPGGTGPGNLAYRVDTARLAERPNWSTETATVTLRATGRSDVHFPVQLNVQLAEVHSIWSNPVAPGAGGTVKAFGRGFSGLAANRFQLAGLPGATATVVSDTEALIDLPTTAVSGSYELTVSNALQLPTRGALLGVAQQPTFGAASVPTTGNKRSLLVDSLHGAIFSANRGNNSITRFRYRNGGWEASETPVPSIGDIGLSRDKRTLYATSGSETLLTFDADTLQPLSTYVLPPEIRPGINLSLPPSSGLTSGLQVTSDMRLWLGNTDQWTRLTYFDLLDGQFHFHSGSGLRDSWASLYHPTMAASSDGSRMVIAESGKTIVEKFMYAPAVPALSPLPESTETWKAMLSADGSKLFSSGRTLYDTAQFNTLGAVTNVPDAAHAIMSPDGRWIYLLVRQPYTPNTVDKVEVYDTSSQSDGNFAKAGEFPVTDQAQACSLAYGSECGALAIHPDGRTLFWAGNQRLVVLPIPQAYRAAPASGARLKAATP